MVFPFLGFNRQFRVRGRLYIYRKKGNNWRALGAKQRRVCKTIYGNDKTQVGKSAGGFLRRPNANYLHRASLIIRDDATRRAPLRCMDLEASTTAGSILRIAQSSDGPSYMYADDVRDGAGEFRRVGYGFYAEDFYNDVSRSAIDRQARVDQVQVQMMGLCKNELASLKPKFSEAREAMRGDISPLPGRGE